MESTIPNERRHRWNGPSAWTSTPRAARWLKQGFDLGFGAGITAGYATIGAIGFEGRLDYAAIGGIVNLASRLCDEAPGGHILVSQRALGPVEEIVEAERFGELSLKGFPRKIPALNILRLRRPPSPPRP